MTDEQIRVALRVLKIVIGDSRWHALGFALRPNAINGIRWRSFSLALSPAPWLTICAPPTSFLRAVATPTSQLRPAFPHRARGVFRLGQALRFAVTLCACTLARAVAEYARSPFLGGAIDPAFSPGVLDNRLVIAWGDYGSNQKGRSHRRASSTGKTVHLSPRTAQTVAMALHLYAEGPPDLRSFSHRVEDWTEEPQSVLCYANNATLVIGAWEAYAPQFPSRAIARWGGWTMRSNRRDRAW